jgi:branched-chain amino acid transport system permease protein
MRRARGYWELAAAVLLAVVAYLLPDHVSDFRLVEFAKVGIYFIAILGLYLLTTETGQISIGHGAFMAIGGYTTAMLMVHREWTDWTTIPLAGLTAGVAGVLFGISALRLQGLYLALATFAMAVSVPSLIKKWESGTGGSSGLIFATFHTNRWYYAVTWGCAGALFVLAWLLVRSKLGRAWRSLRDSDVAATAFGINRALYLTLAAGISAFYAGIAGSLLVILSFGAQPGRFPVELSIYLLVGLVVGGFGPLLGLLVGAAFIQYVQVYAPEWVSDSPGVPTFAFGVALVLAVFLVAGLRPLTNRWHTGRKRVPEAAKETS